MEERLEEMTLLRQDQCECREELTAEEFKNMEEWLEEMTLLRQDQRECRKELTAEEFKNVPVCYVLDDPTRLPNDDTKSWTAARGDIDIVGADCAHLSLAEQDAWSRILEDVRELIPDLMEDTDLISSIYSYCLAGSSCISTYKEGIFVTRNDKMLKLITEEGTREELHAAMKARGFSGVRCYMFIDDDGRLERAKLKWDDAARPSDQRLLQYYGVSSLRFKELLELNNHSLD